MVRLTLTDGRNVLLLTEGCIPAVKELASIYPGEHRYRRDLSALPTDGDDAVAWILTAYSQRLAAGRGYRGSTDPPMETWLISSPKAPDASLQGWFEGMPEEYRVLVHRTPVIEQPARRPYAAWDHVYDRMPIRHRVTLAETQRDSAMELLGALLPLYRAKHDDRVTFFDGIGHRFTYSAGLCA